ncbi:MAG: RagB/SusD family nutrient uptake outer membrane protein [Candidatus Cryptobacteroides sp.]|jgi:hypothetical protein
MKTFKIWAVVLCSIMLGACSKDILELSNPNSLTSATAFDTEVDINSSLVGIYHSFYSSYYSMMNTFQFSGQSDEATSESAAWIQQYVKHVYSDMNCRWNFTSYNQLYQQIARCNQVITYAENIEEWKTYEKEQILAQARVIRAYDYYQLAMMYQIPPYVDYVASAGDQPEAGVFDDLCQKIIEDANYAYKVLPASYQASAGYNGPWKDSYMVTKWFAACVMAKTYLNWGDYLKGDYHYTEALPIFRDIIENGGFTMVSDYADNFKSTTENNSESIFEIQFETCSSNFGNYWGITNNGANVSTSSWRWKFLGTGPVGWTDQSSEYWVLPAFKNEKSKVHINGSEWDSRIPATIFYADIFNDFPQHVQWETWTATEGRRTANDEIGPDGAGFSFKDWVPTRVYCNKYCGQYQDYVTLNASGVDGTNLRVFRLGEILLDYAECLAQTGDLKGAVAVIDQVRARAGLSPLGERQNYKVESVWTNPETGGKSDFNAEYAYAAFENNSSSYTLADIMKVLDLESMKEGAFELDRLMDIRRWGLSYDNDYLAKVKKRSYKYHANFTPVRAWIPLPTDDVQNNPNLEQLKGW